MSNFTLSPNMSLPIPTVGEDPGPDYATNLNSSLTLVDSHDHSSGSGVQITPSGLNINADFSQGNNNVTNIKTLRLFNQTTPIAGAAPNLGVLYRAGVDLYYNDGSGNQIAITTAGSVNAGAGSITGLPSGTASASFAAGTFTWRSATLKAATMDLGGLTIRESGVTSANGIGLVSPTALGAGYTMTLLSALPGTTQALNITAAGNMGTITYDNIGAGMTATGANAVLASVTIGTATSSDAIGLVMTSSGANPIAAARTRTTGTSVGIGGVAISGNSGGFATFSTSPVAITNFSLVITTSGRPVRVEFDPFPGASNLSYAEVVADSGGYFVFRRDGIQIARIFTNSSSANSVSPGVKTYGCLDAVAAGTYTYTGLAYVITGSGAAIVNECRLIAYEL